MFQVVKGNYEPIIGRAALEKMQMIYRNVSTVHQAASKDKTSNLTASTVLDEYKDLFQGIGKLPGNYKIHIDKSVRPVIHPPRTIPHAVKHKVKTELDHMEELGIIEKVPHNEPSEWVSSLVTVNKPSGEVRLCLDPRDLNLAIQREHHPITTVEEIAAKVQNAKFFTLLDARSAFYQIVLDSESSKLLTFNTPFGRYRYLRMPMGIRSASEVYQRRMQEVLEGLDGVEAGMDDILIWASNEQEHDERLRNVLDRLRKYGLRLKREKCYIKQPKIKFHGHIFTENGLQPNDDKCKAIREMPVPEKKEDLKCFLGMVNYVGKFIPNLSELSAPIRELLQKDVAWHWTAQHTKCFQTLKDALTSPTVLAFYNPNLPLTLQVDASSKGMGAALFQNGRPIAYASKALTNAQQSYAQIEKEMLAILFGCQKFENYIIGRETIVESDHKPLETITKKPLFKAPLRLQRMLIELQRFPDIIVKYKKGSTIQVADALSRSYIDNDSQQWICDLQVKITDHVPASPQKLAEITYETNKDATLQILKQVILNGWPSEKKAVPQEVQEFWNYRDELSVVDNLILKGSKWIVPKSLRKEMLNRLHQSHLGMVKTKQRAREIFYWPRMNYEIEELIKRCPSCAENQSANAREPLICHDIPDRPWTKVACDLFTLKGANYLLCVDFYSKYPEVTLLQSTTSKAVITGLKSIFARHGIPEELFSDNGPQFSSSDFQQFSKQWEFTHKTSSPRYPQSNGQAEKFVHTIKQLLKKAADPYLAILEYRNTPIDKLEASPSQLLMSRRLRSILPISKTLLEPKLETNVKEKLLTRQNSQKLQYDKSAYTLPELDEGQHVRYKQGTWRPARILEKLPHRSYLIENEHHQVLRRNRTHLRSDASNENNLTGCQTPVVKFVTPHDTPTVESLPTTNSQDNPQAHYLPLNKTRSGRMVRKPSRLNL